MARKVWAEDAAAPGDYQDSAMSAEGVPGLTLRVTASSRTWMFRARVRGGRQVRSRIGSYPSVTLDAARLQAQRLRDEAREGSDFQSRIATERAERDAGAMMFSVLRDRYLANNAERLKSGEIRQPTARSYKWVLTSDYVAPLERRLVGTIKKGEMRALYTRIAGLGYKTTAVQVARSLRAMFAYGVEHGLLAANPAAKLNLEGVQSDAAPLIRWREGEEIDFGELVATLAAIDHLEQERPLSAWWDIYRLCALTGMRPTVVEGLAWPELSLGDKPMLHLPAARSKLRTPSIIPLSDVTAEILRSLQPKEEGLVFPGRSGDKPLEKPKAEPVMLKTYLAADAKRNGWPPFRQARLRDTFAEWAAITRQPTDAVDLLVGHAVRRSTRQKHYTTFSPVEEARRVANEWATTVAAELKKARRKRSKGGKFDTMPLRNDQ